MVVYHAIGPQRRLREGTITLAGHRHLSTTQLYIEVNDQMMKAAVEVLWWEEKLHLKFITIFIR